MFQRWMDSIFEDLPFTPSVGAAMYRILVEEVSSVVYLFILANQYYLHIKIRQLCFIWQPVSQPAT